jgi:hypothetical protein
MALGIKSLSEKSGFDTASPTQPAIFRIGSRERYENYVDWNCRGERQNEQ